MQLPSDQWKNALWSCPGFCKKADHIIDWSRKDRTEKWNGCLQESGEPVIRTAVNGTLWGSGKVIINRDGNIKFEFKNGKII